MLKKLLSLFLGKQESLNTYNNHLKSSKKHVWIVDPVYSRVSWSITHMGLIEVEGVFREFEGYFTATPPHFKDIQGEFTIWVESIDTQTPPRDARIKSEAFLDVKRYPTIHFKTKKVRWRSLGRLQIIGDLTIKDVTKEVTFTGYFKGFSLKDPLFGLPRAAFEVEGKISRSDFGALWKEEKQLKSAEGVYLLSDEVKFSVKMELTTPKVREIYQQSERFQFQK